MQIQRTKLGDDTMATVVITLKIMPTGVDVNLDELKGKATLEIKQLGGEVGKDEIQPVAFGLNALILIFLMDESIGSTEDLENNISALDGVNSVQVTDVRRAIG